MRIGECGVWSVKYGVESRVESVKCRMCGMCGSMECGV